MLNRNEILKQEVELYKTLIMMCKAIDVDINKVDFNDNLWFQKHEWTEEQEQKFKEKMVAYLLKNRKARKALMTIVTPVKSYIEKTVDYFLFMYGWKIRRD